MSTEEVKIKNYTEEDIRNYMDSRLSSDEKMYILEDLIIKGFHEMSISEDRKAEREEALKIYNDPSRSNHERVMNGLLISVIDFFEKEREEFL